VGDHVGLRAVRLASRDFSGETVVESGSLEWTGRDWLVTGDAGWLLDRYHAVLPTDSGSRPVHPSEGTPYLYAVWFSYRATYSGVELYGADGEAIDRASALADIETLQSLGPADPPSDQRARR
jgi:hypothetical protein